MGEMAGKVTREYNVSMDIHGLSAHPMGEMAGKVTREYNVSMDIHGYPWIVRAPHGGRWLLGNTLYLWIHHSMDCPRTPWGNYSFHGYQYCQISGAKIRIAMNWPKHKYIFFPGPGNTRTFILQGLKWVQWPCRILIKAHLRGMGSQLSNKKC